MNLTEHFTYEELWHSDTAIRLGINNEPPPEMLPRLKLLAMTLEQVRGIVQLPVNVNSAFRCEALERVLAWKDFMAWAARRKLELDETVWQQYFALKGHPQGYCADITCRAFGTPRDMLRAIVRNKTVKFDQLIEEGTWGHISIDPRMRGEIIVATFVNGVPQYEKVDAL